MGDNPLVLGLICEFDVTYIKGYYHTAIKELDENDINKFKLDECELTEELYNLGPFKLIKYETEDEVIISDRSKLLSDLLILRGNRFYLNEDEIYP